MLSKARTKDEGTLMKIITLRPQEGVVRDQHTSASEIRCTRGPSPCENSGVTLAMLQFPEIRRVGCPFRFIPATQSDFSFPPQFFPLTCLYLVFIIVYKCS